MCVQGHSGRPALGVGVGVYLLELVGTTTLLDSLQMVVNEVEGGRMTQIAARSCSPEGRNGLGDARPAICPEAGPPAAPAKALAAPPAHLSNSRSRSELTAIDVTGF